MFELRLILLGVGLVVIALIYFWGMRARIRERLEERRRRAQARLQENEPVVPDDIVEHEPQDVWAASEVRVIHPGNGRTETAGERSAVSPVPQDDSDQEAPGAPVIPDLVAAKTASADAAEAEQASAASAQPSTPPASVKSTASRASATPSVPKAGAKTAAAESAREDPPATSPRPRSTRAAEEPASPPAMTVLMTVLAPTGQSFTGGAIRSVCGSLHLVLGERGIWECRSDNGDMIFGIGHLREPGVFDAAHLDALRTSGLLLFLKLPGPVNAITAVDRMIKVASDLARRLDGSVCDERRNRMTTQAMIRLRSEAAEFEQRRRLTAQP